MCRVDKALPAWQQCVRAYSVQEFELQQFTSNLAHYAGIITLLLNYLGLHSSELTSSYWMHLVSTVVKLLE